MKIEFYKNWDGMIFHCAIDTGHEEYVSHNENTVELNEGCHNDQAFFRDNFVYQRSFERARDEMMERLDNEIENLQNSLKELEMKRDSCKVDSYKEYLETPFIKQRIEDNKKFF